ncbi:MAG: aminotransferase class I/II-fold pyridoxal phosphate-dependent enzyme [Acutalibacteraceae bacterium]|nr:aminotransferase class I/II-fold pyridoxal phosphate-dependent enzyme [Acutalibacteraceae bacterium]
MASYLKMKKEELAAEFQTVKKEYDRLKSLGTALDMTRGKPGFDQMDECSEIFDLVGNTTGFTNCEGTDCRNYGGLDGLIELKYLFSHILGVDHSQIIVGGNSSLNMMFDTIAQGMTHGFGDKPWLLQEGIKFICPCPGYDRHFAITEHFGIEMIPVRNTPEGPDMDVIEELIKDEKVKGMWCVPKYSNPEGITYSDDTVRRLASMKPAARDFRIMWDNAYAIHDLYDKGDKLLNIYHECVKHGTEDKVIMFTSSSKITFPGAGVAAEAASPYNVSLLKKRMSFQTIGPDKLNQLRHARMFPNFEALKKHMKKHANILRPKFEAVLNELNKQLGDKDIAEWTNPLGGYFVSLNVRKGCAKRVEQLCAEAGLKLTSVGATFPYGKDPDNSNIRIAPSYPSVDEVKKASEILCYAIRYATLETLL